MAAVMASLALGLSPCLMFLSGGREAPPSSWGRHASCVAAQSGCVQHDVPTMSSTSTDRDCHCRACVHPEHASSLTRPFLMLKSTTCVISSRLFRVGRVCASLPAEADDGGFKGFDVSDDVRSWEKRGNAPPEKVAALLPSWAAEILLDDDARSEYDKAQEAERVSTYKEVRGRTWNDDSEEGLGAFTPLEIAEDFGIPVEDVIEKMRGLGVRDENLQANRPVTENCSNKQVHDLTQFVQGADPIELRSERSDFSIKDVANDLGLHPQALVMLCRRLDIRTDLDEDTHLRWLDDAALKMSAKREYGVGDD